MELLKVMLVILMVIAEFATTTPATPIEGLPESKLLPSTTSLSHCRKTCGQTNISNIFYDSREDWPYPGQYYPFGFGSSCSRPGFELICNNSFFPGKVYLGDGTTEIIYGGYDNNIGLLEVKFKIHIMDNTTNTYRGSWNPGKPFAAYARDTYNSSFVVIGCWVDAYLLDENHTKLGSCSTTCKSDNEIRQEAECNGFGCCSIPINHKPSPIYFNINRNKEKSELALKNVKAFMHTYTNYSSFDDFEKYIFSQEDLNSIDTVQGMGFFNMLLEWSIPGPSTCEKAKDNKTTYACVSNHSECISNTNGYTCLCSPNYYGDAYIRDGCQDLNPYNRSRPGPNCTQEYCGNISVPFPFGISKGCYGKESFRLDCKNAQLFLSLTNGNEFFGKDEENTYQVTEILVSEGLLQVNMSLNNSYSLGVQDSAYTSNGQWANLNWVIDNITCPEAKQNKNDYACVSKNSECLDINNTNWGNLGYRCKCKLGYQGNPYLDDGCKAM